MPNQASAPPDRCTPDLTGTGITSDNPRMPRSCEADGLSHSGWGRIQLSGMHPMTRIRLTALIAASLLIPAWASEPSSHAPRRPSIRYFIATAYSVEGTGAAGKWSHPGTVAADRKILPLNSRIRVYGAGQYSGEYTVEDTGGKVDGHHIDLYMPSHAEAKAFGRQRVKVVVLSYGDDQPQAPDPQQKAEAKAENHEERKAASPRPTDPNPHN